MLHYINTVSFENSWTSIFIYIFSIKHLDKCSKSATGGMAGDGDDATKGNCPGTNDFCYMDGICRGIN